MKRLIDYIKNLFGADEKLRKWCIMQINGNLPHYGDSVIEQANDMYIWIKSGRTPL